MKKIHYLCSGEAVKDDSELSDHECWEQKKRATYHKPHVRLISLKTLKPYK